MERFLMMWFWMPRWIDGLRHTEWNRGPVADFRAQVWRRADRTGEPFEVAPNAMKWLPEWRAMYLRSQGLVVAWYAALALTLAPVVVLPAALLWWLSQHVTIGWQ